MITKKSLYVAINNYLNAAPLNYGLLCGLGSPYIKLRAQVPSKCADSLKQGRADIGLISSIEYLRIPNIKIIPNHCISSISKVNSVIILTKNAPNMIRTLAVDNSSRTSVILSQIILIEKYGVRPTIIEMPPDQNQMLSQCDAALLIGDNAMRANRDDLIILDLAEEWHNLTNLPFVFAIWAIKNNALNTYVPFNISALISQSLTLGKQNLDKIIVDAQPNIGWSHKELKQYLTENILYNLDEAELSGLKLFFHKSHTHGFVDQVKSLDFL